MRWFAALVAASIVVGCGGGAPSEKRADPPGRRLDSISESGDPRRFCDVPRARRGYEAEPAATVDIGLPRHVVAAWQADRLATIGAAGIGLASSDDSGRTWPKRMSIAADCGRALTDPSVALDGDTAYLAYMDVARDKRGVARLVFATIDPFPGTARRVVVDAFNTIDKPALAIDPEQPTIMYLAWIRREGGEHGRSEVMFSATRNRGRAWRKPFALDDQIPVDAQGTEVLALKSGELLVTYAGVHGAGNPARIATIHGTGHGDRWYPLTFAGTSTDYEAKARDRTLRTADFFPAVATDQEGTVVVATQRNVQGRGSIVLTLSSDSGDSWSKPTPIITVRGQVFTPTPAFARDGQLGLAYYVLRGNRVQPWLAQTRPTVSETWTRPRTLALGPPVPLTAVPQADGFLGDFQSLVSTSAGFVPVLAMPDGGKRGPTTIVAGP